MRQLSLRLRSIFLAIVLLALFAPFTVVILDEAYTDSLTQAKMSELRLMNLGLLSAFELFDAVEVVNLLFRRAADDPVPRVCV